MEHSETNKRRKRKFGHLLANNYSEPAIMILQAPIKQIFLMIGISCSDMKLAGQRKALLINRAAVDKLLIYIFLYIHLFPEAAAVKTFIGITSGGN